MTAGTALRGTPLFDSPMPNSRRCFLRVSAALAAGCLAGCAGSARREFARELDPLVGRVDKAYFLEKYGEPIKQTSLNTQTDVWEYSFGHTNLNDYGARGNVTTSTLVQLVFRNGTLTSWQATARMN